MITVAAYPLFRKADGTTVSGPAIVVNNRVIYPAIFFSHNHSVKFKYVIKNNNVSRAVRVRIAHFFTQDPEYKQGFVFTGSLAPDNEEKPWYIVHTYDSKGKLVINPAVIDIQPNSTNEMESTISFTFDANWKKDAVFTLILDEWEIDTTNNVERRVQRYIFEHHFIYVDVDEPNLFNGVQDSTLQGTHVIVAEGILTPVAGSIGTALSSLNTLFSNNMQYLNNLFDASILSFATVRSRNTKGDPVVKTVFLVKESSPIAVIGAILLGLGVLAAIIGILWAVGNIMQIRNEEKLIEGQLRLTDSRVAITERAVVDTNRMVESILNDPNLSPQQKQTMISAIKDYAGSLIQDIERATTLMPPTGGGIPWNLVLLTLGLLTAGIIGAYIYGEYSKTKRFEAATLGSALRGLPRI